MHDSRDMEDQKIWGKGKKKKGGFGVVSDGYTEEDLTFKNMRNPSLGTYAKRQTQQFDFMDRQACCCRRSIRKWAGNLKHNGKGENWLTNMLTVQAVYQLMYMVLNYYNCKLGANLVEHYSEMFEIYQLLALAWLVFAGFHFLYNFVS